MHLVIVSPFPPSITGIGQYGYHLTRALASSGLFSRLTVLAGSSHGQHRQVPNHLGITEIDYCWQLDSIKARKAILSRIRQLNPDLIWFNLGASIFWQISSLQRFGAANSHDSSPDVSHCSHPA